MDIKDNPYVNYIPIDSDASGIDNNSGMGISATPSTNSSGVVKDGSTGTMIGIDLRGSGGEILNDESVIKLLQEIYGDGSDGDVVITSDTDLTDDKYYNSLTIENGSYLKTNGYRVFIKNKLEIAPNSKIGWEGNSGGNGGSVATGSQSGGAGGTAGAVLADGYLSGSPAGKAGGAGGNGGNDVTLVGPPGVAGTNGNNGEANSLGNDGSDSGKGGNGKSTLATAGGAGGAKATGGTEGVSATIVPHNAFLAIRMIDESTIGSPAAYSANASGASGGGGGGGAYSSSDGNGGGGGGGSASPGGLGFISAKQIVNHGSISYNGANGGNGGNGGSYTGGKYAGGGGGGGGAAGNGGYFVLIYNEYGGSGTKSADAGSTGLGGTKGTSLPGLDGAVATDGDDSIAGTGGTFIELKL
jgi:hypothetical protein